MRRMFLVAGHEFLRHLRRPSFLLTTLLLPLMAKGRREALSPARCSSLPAAQAPGRTGRP